VVRETFETEKSLACSGLEGWDETNDRPSSYFTAKEI
jgi:hypothetical protein